MDASTQRALFMYLVALREEGFTRIHVTELIPYGMITANRRIKEWTQFPHLDIPEGINIEYDKSSGWFTLK